MTVKQISAQQLQQMIEHDDIVVIDVRSDESFLQAHIPGAAHISVDGLDAFCAANDKHRKIAVYCYHGISSQSFAQHLKEQGFTEVYSLQGGFEAWQAHHSAAE